MKIPRQLIEKKLSQLLGAEVAFEQLDVSVFTGKLEAAGMTVGGSARPLARVRRITAQIAVAKALAGQIAIKSLVVEGPEIFLTGRAGSFKLPSISGNSEKAKDWEFEAQSVRIVDGRFDFRTSGPGSLYHVSAEKINGELARSNDKTRCEVSIGAINRRDVPVEMKSIRLTGEINGPGPSLKLPIAVTLQISDVANWQAMLPPEFALPPVFSRLKFNGPAEAQIRIQIDPTKGIQIHEANIQAKDISVSLSDLFSPGKP